MNTPTRPELLDPREAHDRIETGALLFDVRRPATRDRDGTVPGAHTVDREDIQATFGSTGERRHDALSGLDQSIVVICGSEVGSAPIAEKLVQLGYTDIAHVQGGFSGWVAADLPHFSPPTSRDGDQ